MCCHERCSVQHSETNMPLTHEQTQALTQRLLAEHGELIGGHALARCLGYRTQRAFQMGIQRGQLPVEAFTLTGRRGHYARTFEVAQWLASCGQSFAIVGADETNMPVATKSDAGIAS